MGLKIVGARIPFMDRHEAGRLLAQALRQEARLQPLVLGIPRGGVVIGALIADALKADLDVVIARKLGAPGNPEVAVGAVMEGGETYLNEEAIGGLQVDAHYLEEEKARQLRLIEQRAAMYRAIRPIVLRRGRNLIVVDDGVATGATMIATLRGLRVAEPASLLCALPVGPPDTLEQLSCVADEVVCLAAPPYFQAVSQFYENFDQVEDAEVARILSAHSGR